MFCYYVASVTLKSSLKKKTDGSERQVATEYYTGK